MRLLEIYELSRDIKNHSNFPFWYSMLHEAASVIDFDKLNTIMDFGAGEGCFSILVREHLPRVEIFNVELSDKLVKRNKYISGNISSVHYRDFKSLPEFDVIFSQEVVYTQKSLSEHAKEVYEKLKPGGHYFFTIGCHLENPTWPSRRRNIVNSEEYPVYDYSLEEVADSFYRQGFRVSLKKLPVRAPIKYVSNSSEFSDITSMLNSCEDHKMLFVILKPYKDFEKRALHS